MISKPHSQPGMFAIIPEAITFAADFAKLWAHLKEKGNICAAWIDADDTVIPIDATATPPANAAAWIIVTHALRRNQDILSSCNAGILVKVAAILRGNGVSARIVSDSVWEAQRGWKIADRFHPEPDRDLELRSGERFIADLTSNAVRSSIWLIERDGELCIRKAFSRYYPGFLENELAARRVMGDKRVVEISEQRGDVLYMPFIRGSMAWDGRLLSFCQRDHVRAVRAFLTDLNRIGYSMVDINPSAFLFDRDGALRVVDFEFFVASQPATDFLLSNDYSGKFDTKRAPKKNGWARYWHDAIGGRWEQIEQMSQPRYRAHLMFHLVSYRVPVRVGRWLERSGKLVANRVRRIAGLRFVGNCAGQFVV
ncbi:MAG: hypothetical protein KDJ47_14640 [Hyphomicrobiaceae bacterium]|nr:hypothetical protein [Hyphomicrobiaceae bacterium]